MGTPADARVEGDTIVLGAAVSLTGKYSHYGLRTQRGYDFAVTRINELGGVRVHGTNYKLKVVYYDDESTPARAVQLADRLINQDGIKFMLGPFSSSLTNAIASVTEKYEIPMVQSQGASRSLFTQGYRYLFGVSTPSEQFFVSAIRLAARRAEQLGKRPSDVKVAMAFENDPFSLDVRIGAVEEARSFGMEIVIDDKLPQDLSDMTSTLVKVKAAKPDLLVVSGHSRGATTAARQMKEMEVEAPIVVMTHCESASLIANFGASVEGLLCPTQWSDDLVYRDDIFGSSSDYAKAFKKVFFDLDSVPPESAQASVAVQVWADAFARANSFDTERVRDALAETDMNTFYGPVRFSEAGANVGKPMILEQISDGRFIPVDPPEATPSVPDWVKTCCRGGG